MSLSSRHHYIPQFLIRNFTNDQGFLYVYNKVLNRIDDNPKSPKAIFYEFDRNSATFEGIKNVNLEGLYAQLDDKYAVDLKNVLINKSMSPEELTSIVALASLLKWRTPKKDAEFNVLKNDTTNDDLGIEIGLKGGAAGADQAILDKINNSEMLKEVKRILLSLVPFVKNEDKLLEIHNNSFINSNELYPALIGDCPIIERLNSDYRDLEEFIFPLSSDDTFIYKRNSQKAISNTLFYFQRDLTIMHYSDKYVGCKSRKHLENILKMYKEIEKSELCHALGKYAFEYVT